MKGRPGRHCADSSSVQNGTSGVAIPDAKFHDNTTEKGTRNKKSKREENN
jgi:hypothetical protein